MSLMILIALVCCEQVTDRCQQFCFKRILLPQYREQSTQTPSLSHSKLSRHLPFPCLLKHVHSADKVRDK